MLVLFTEFMGLIGLYAVVIIIFSGYIFVYKNFLLQDLTGIEDMSICRDVLQRHNWNLEVAVQVQIWTWRMENIILYFWNRLSLEFFIEILSVFSFLPNCK